MVEVTSSLSLLILTFALFRCLSLGIASYDYFQFVQQWPPHFCYRSNGTNRPCIINRQSFTIHGLWPSNFSQAVYNYNCNGAVFNNGMYSNKTLVNDLTRSWPDLKSGNNPRLFWEEQWDKHGRCSNQTYGQTRYFQRAFEMWNQFNITNIFSAAGVITTQPRIVNASDLERRIEAAIHSIPVLRCRKAVVQNGQPPVDLIYEVGICYDYVGTTLIPCNPKQGRCSTANDIYF